MAARCQRRNYGKRLYKLTRCRDFESLDSMNDNCVNCLYTDKKLFEKCKQFTFDK